MQKNNYTKIVQETPKPDYIGVFVVAISFGLMVCYASVGETLATPLVTDMYGLSDGRAVFLVSVVLAVMDGFGILSLLIVTKFTSKIDDRKLLIGLGIIPIVVGVLLHYPMGNKPIVIANCTANLNDTITTTTFSTFYEDSHHVNLKISDYFQDRDINHNFVNAKTSRGSNSTEDCNGCPYLTQSWCLDTPQITPPQLIISYCIAMAGLFFGMSFTQAVFSKILGPTPLGVWMGLLAGCAAIVRITGPMWISYVYEALGIIYIYIILACLEIFVLCSLLISYKRLAPMKASNDQCNID